MAGNTLTFALGGRVEIGKLVEGASAFKRLIDALTPSKDVAWVIEDLQASSAVVTLRGEADDPATVERVVDEYAAVGGRLARQEILHFGPRVVQAADAISNLAQTVEYVRFETPDADYTIYGNGKSPKQSLSKSVGAITGRVQTLSSRGALRFNLYDAVYDRAVGCYLMQGQEEIMREAWGRRARVTGSISREQPTGRPVAIRQIVDVKILEEFAPGSYRRARGAVKWEIGDRLPEEVIRQLRDA